MSSIEMGRVAPRGGEENPFPGLDVSFFYRVYRTSLWVTGLIALILLEWQGWRLSLGLITGAIVSMVSLISVEWTVRLLFRGGGFAGAKLVFAAVIKYPFLLMLLLGTAWASYHRHINVFAVVGGVVLIHVVMVCKLLGAAYLHHNKLESSQG